MSSTLATRRKNPLSPINSSAPARRVAVTWNLASGISSALFSVQQWCTLYERRSALLSEALRPLPQSSSPAAAGAPALPRSAA